jgi:hypothetical protein
MLGDTDLRAHICFCRLAILGAALAGQIVIGISSSRAGEAAYCLSCTGPDKTYLCKVTGENATHSDVVRVYCIVRTLKKGKHDSCVVIGSPEKCPGVVRTFKYRGPTVPAGLADSPRVKRFLRKVEEDYGTPPATTRTLQENAPPLQKETQPRRSMLQRIGKVAQSAGASVGGFAQTSYSCLRSLFRKCGREQ